MTEKEKVNFQVRPETIARIEVLAKRTFRTKGAVIDWLVDEKWKELEGETKEGAEEPFEDTSPDNSP